MDIRWVQYVGGTPPQGAILVSGDAYPQVWQVLQYRTPMYLHGSNCHSKGGWRSVPVEVSETPSAAETG